MRPGQMSFSTKLLRFPSKLRNQSAAGRSLRAAVPAAHSGSSASAGSAAKSLTTLQEANPRNLPELWFSSASPGRNDNNDVPLGPGRRPRSDERKVKLGKTLRILQERLPTLLQSPLPQEILSPNISLHLFPSTHPHLPTVSGRVAYIAALWTSPIAWNRVPIVGNVQLEILSERMVSQPGTAVAGGRRIGAVGEQLIVRWRTIGKTKGWGLSFKEDGAAGDVASVGADGEFTGLFIFDFDREGRILSHTIEHVQEGGQWERGMGAKVVGLTDWLLRGIRGGREGGDAPCPAFARRQR